MAQTQSKTAAAALRKFLNKREEIAVQVLAGLVHNPALTQMATIREVVKGEGLEHTLSVDLSPVVDAAVAAADALLQKLYIHEDKAGKEAAEA